MELTELQHRIEALYGARDRARGVDWSFRWWVGEVVKAVRSGDPAVQLHGHAAETHCSIWLWVQGVAGSNPAVPTTSTNALLSRSAGGPSLG